MESSESGEKKKKISILKKLEKFVSIKRRSKSTKTTFTFTKSRSWHSTTTVKASTYHDDNGPITKREVAPNGCFSVHVGSEKQRFVIKTEFANHPLFKMLLQDAELEYGFKREGPIQLPCEVDLFIKVLAEMDGGDDQEFDGQFPCGFRYGACSPFSPKRRRFGPILQNAAFHCIFKEEFSVKWRYSLFLWQIGDLDDFMVGQGLEQKVLWVS
ncbi:hypothetical protein BUALT_Bualt02G0091300 [Buddleja alternifolia]|uniref:Small auxin up regulated protein n=1 Tax=Buddleja alternifolia TaxID=168488 RepID=A0AAV6Y514_9LAMI|nr:hypothetical protein BUALT_Bualt02G0091300 [Buddleja alternifolia]